MQSLLCSHVADWLFQHDGMLADIDFLMKREIDHNSEFAITKCPTRLQQGVSSLAVATVLFLSSCAHQLPTYEKPLARTAVQKVRTTAYTHSERDHHRYGACSALGTPLKYGALNSAAADWARWPAGTRFRIKPTGENFIVDDYGFALAGTNTIDLYKPTRTAMSQWGVRRVTIEIIEWGDPWHSYLLLSKVKGYRHIHRMLQEIRKFFPK
ncbi:MAG: hypothetical protein QE493_01190 [Verrucomicrobiae bacterium]|jgi:3D (Asp-Asp-Asp) domain-containing protein|nr:hypothetical protein [Verrucomicrobiae bacterium]